MPRYFFDFDDGESRTLDDEGSELDDFEQARSEAVRMLPEIARDKMPDGEHQQLTTTIRDEKGNILYRATLTFQGEKLAG